MKQIDREAFIQEQQLRKHIRKAITISESKEKNILQQKLKLRQNIRKLLKEVEVEDKVPHHNTGINVLEDLLKKIIPILEDDYKMLTTNVQQRKSFRAHIINAVQNSLAPGRARERAGVAPKEAEKMIPVTEEEKGEEIDDPDIEIDIGDDIDGPTDAAAEIEAEIPDNEGAFIDIEKQGRDVDNDSFSLPGEDTTGRNMALQSFEKIEKNIVEAYGSLSNEEDKNLFYDYILINLKLYNQKFEDELEPTLEEPSTEEFEIENIS